MCGIAGEFSSGGLDRAQSAAEAMVEVLAHRGPEGHTLWFSDDGKACLAHAQLSFFKGAETQPVFNVRNTVFAVCNGEIYNYRELAALLRQSGIAIEPRSDVEIIPYLYQWRGPSTFALLRGEFAFALYDSETQKLFLARDRLGIKPLYYRAAGGALSFASEIKGLFGDPRIARALDPATVAAKLFGITLPGNTTFSGIREVKPAAYVEFGTAGLSERPYWSLQLKPDGAAMSAAERAEKFLDVFDEAVRVRLHGDYPIGAYLSGGIDSSAVLASMAHAGVAPKAFTISFADRLLDESPTAVATARHLGVEHHLVPISDKDIADNFLPSIWHSEIPVVNCHGTAKFMLSRAASERVKAIMTGEGADELFAGYPYFGVDHSATARGFGQQAAAWMRILTSRRFGSDFPSVPREKDVRRLAAAFGCTPHLAMRALFYGRLIRPLLKRDFVRHFSPVGTIEALLNDLKSANAGAMSPTNLDRFLALKYDLPAYLLNFLADRQEMAHTIEGRVPFLDDNVVAFAATLPDEALIGAFAGKQLIRDAFAKRLPSQALASRKKLFLAPPTAVDEILKSDWADHLLSREVIDAVGVFDAAKLGWLRFALKLVPAHSGAGSALRSLVVLILSLHGLHDMFVAGHARRPAIEAAVRRRDRD
jgi:asparagine synthase (glutamine-hydrolysing)